MRLSAHLVEITIAELDFAEIFTDETGKGGAHDATKLCGDDFCQSADVQVNVVNRCVNGRQIGSRLIHST